MAQEVCSISHGTRNVSDPLRIGSALGGVPANFVWNFLAWIFLLVVFYLTRKIFIGRILEEKWSFLKIKFNSSRIFSVFQVGNGESARVKDNNDDLSCVDSSKEVNYSIYTDELITDHTLRARVEELSKRRHQGEEINSCWEWFKFSLQWINFTDEEVHKLAGIDGVQYLRFERHLLVIVSFLSVLSLAFILPINVSSIHHLNSTHLELSHLAMTSRGPRDPLLYFHTFLTFLLFPVSIAVMRNFSKGLNLRNVAVTMTKTLVVKHIPQTVRDRALIERHFKEAYPNNPVKAINMAYDIKQLTKATYQLQDARDSRKEAEWYKRHHPGESLKMKPVWCSRFFSFLCFWIDEVDVIEFYTKEEERLELEIKHLTEQSLKSTLGICFVTFSSVNDSKEIYDDFDASFLNLYKKYPNESSISKELNVKNWDVSFAPVARDIHWHNLEDVNWWLWFKIILSDIIMVLLCLFLTTPEYILSHIDDIMEAINPELKSSMKDSMILKYLPQLILTSITLIIPTIVTQSVRQLGYWYRSTENFQVMRRAYWYLWISVILFPTLGLTSGTLLIKSFVKNIVNTTTTSGDVDIVSVTSIPWHCVLLPDSGAFYISYVVAAGFFGTSMQLLRIGDFFAYIWYSFLTMTPANKPTVDKLASYEFRFGENYAHILSLFSLVMLYGISIPLVAPAGLLFFILKYLVDKHNISLVFEPSEIDNKQHKSAINFVMFAVVLPQLFMTIYSIIRTFSEKPIPDQSFITSLSLRTVISIFLFVITAVLFLSSAYYQVIKKLGPHKYVEPIFQDVNDDDNDKDPYIPGVLLDELKPFMLKHAES